MDAWLTTGENWINNKRVERRATGLTSAPGGASIMGYLNSGRGAKTARE
jgi:hypothetical protein